MPQPTAADSLFLPLPDTSDAGTSPVQTEPVPRIVVCGRRLEPTRVFDTYWRFAAARQALHEARLQGRAAPWTGDPILRRHRFTNCYRAADRVSQFLISQVIYQGPQDPDDVVFRTLLFKMFNRIPTWQRLETVLGEVSWQEYDYARYERVLTAAFQSGERLYSAAYVIPPPRFGESRKHANHLRLLELMMSTGVAEKVKSAGSLRGTFEVLRSYPAIGDFLAYQYAIDLNYSSVLEYDEMEFVVPGPGARDGIRKCFGRSADGIEADVIRYMSDHQEEHFARLGLSFGGLRGRRLQLVDCQNLFCEVDKYSRVAHPDVPGISGRTRIKQSFRPVAEPVPAWFPPKWGINQGLAMPSPRCWPNVVRPYDAGMEDEESLFAGSKWGGGFVNPIKDVSPDSADLVAALAVTLERLTARVSRDLDVDAGESVLPDDPFWADTISQLAKYARECAEVLDEPRITAMLSARAGGRLPAAPASH